MEFSRRSFLAGLAAATVATVVPKGKAEATLGKDSYATLIDLEKCDGCKGKPQPLCVTSCREKNTGRFPEPDPAKLKDYWPQKKHEDWSKKRDVINRLTPYNWTFVQKVEVEHEGEVHDVSVPRRCMHCDNPACVKLCPFGVNHKDKNGPVHIDPDLCFGGAKCRTVCPWSVPQRQAGVGISTYLDPLPVGGGVMYKCDLCRDRLAQGKVPSCVEACPKKALKIGTKNEIKAMAMELQEKYSGHLYGLEENGGTSTVYVSRVPFEKIDKAIVAQAKKAPVNPKTKKPQKPMRMHKPVNKLEEKSELAVAALAAPFIGMAGAFAATVARTEKRIEKKEDTGNE